MMRLQNVTYFAQLDSELISVPDFPAWVCDLCGQREYDPRAISRLNVLLAPHTKRPSRASHRSHTSHQGPPSPSLSD
jgi:YgiT-type zinc finger domain-containing protein